MLLRKPWCICTSDIRMLQFVNQHRCDGTHQHEESMSGNARMTAYYTPSFADIILEAWYPQAWYKHVPQLASVTKWVLRYIKVAELLALCGIKHFELDPSPKSLALERV